MFLAKGETKWHILTEIQPKIASNQASEAASEMSRSRKKEANKKRATTTSTRKCRGY